MKPTCDEAKTQGNQQVMKRTRKETKGNEANTQENQYVMQRTRKETHNHYTMLKYYFQYTFTHD